jgi:hypothetical protein
MAKTLLRLTKMEAVCVYSSLHNELRSLEAEINTGNLTSEKLGEIKETIKQCKSVLEKIESQI